MTAPPARPGPKPFPTGAVLCLAALGLLGVRRLGKGLAAAAVIERDLPFAAPDGKPLLLDIARPRGGKGPFAALLCLHGGGWGGGDKKDCHHFLRAFAARGYVAAAAQYRLAPRHRFPAQLEDARAAIRFLRERAGSLEVDPGRIGVMGGSAGGHLALLAAMAPAREVPGSAAGDGGASSDVAAAASISGPTDLTRPLPGLEKVLEGLLGAPRDRDLEAYARASPARYARSGGPPLWLVHGTQDPIVPYAQSAALLEACRRAGQPAELVTIHGGGHGSGGPDGDWRRAFDSMAAFFDARLRGQGRPIHDERALSLGEKR